MTGTGLAPLLVIGIGNDSRGDDAAGPLLLQRLAAAGVTAGGGVELLSDYQLQVEHALDLAGREAVLFVDAAWPTRGTGPGLGDPVRLEAVTPGRDHTISSHALSPRALLQVAVDLNQAVPPAWLLAVEGRHFELGEPPTADLLERLDHAEALARQWLSARPTAS